MSRVLRQIFKKFFSETFSFGFFPERTALPKKQPFPARQISVAALSLLKISLLIKI